MTREEFDTLTEREALTLLYQRAEKMLTHAKTVRSLRDWTLRKFGSAPPLPSHIEQVASCADPLEVIRLLNLDARER